MSGVEVRKLGNKTKMAEEEPPESDFSKKIFTLDFPRGKRSYVWSWFGHPKSQDGIINNKLVICRLCYANIPFNKGNCHHV